MNLQTKLKIAKYLRNSARYFLLVTGLLVFVFALLSGSERFGGGIIGIIKNSPNALPWLLFLIFVFFAWKWELVGGIIITLFGVAALMFFNSGPNFFWIPFVIALIFILFGSFFLLSWYLTKQIKLENRKCNA
jgi:hypothetical protein